MLQIILFHPLNVIIQHNKILIIMWLFFYNYISILYKL
jgi:hypothetical protein